VKTFPQQCGQHSGDLILHKGLALGVFAQRRSIRPSTASQMFSAPSTHSPFFYSAQTSLPKRARSSQLNVRKGIPIAEDGGALGETGALMQPFVQSTQLGQCDQMNLAVSWTGVIQATPVQPELTDVEGSYLI
jgi:hypothetical protein